MKKALHYFQKQALQYSDEKYNSAAYLSPRRNHEPQQQHRSKHSTNNNDDIKPLFSTATTAVNPPPYRPQRPDQQAHQPSYSSSRRNIPPTPPHISAHIQRIQYASDHIRQSYELYLCPPPSTGTPSSSSSSFSSTTTSSNSLPPHYHQPNTSPESQPQSTREQYFIIYVPSSGHMHDHTITAPSFHPALNLLTSSHPPTKHPHTHPPNTNPSPWIRGYASINYRLASPRTPTPTSTPTPSASSNPYDSDTGTFDDALHDLLTAMQHLQRRFPELKATGRYLLVGHGFGALLALNALMRMREEARWGITPPRGVVGVNGVYDLGMLHRERGEFEGLTRRIIGDEGRWGGGEGVSAVGWRGERWRGDGEGEGDAEEGERGKRCLLLAHSREDRLVGFAQAESLYNVLAAEGVTADSSRDEAKSGPQIMCELLEINGRHNECWENGQELARAIREGLAKVLSLDA